MSSDGPTCGFDDNVPNILDSGTLEHQSMQIQNGYGYYVLMR